MSREAILIVDDEPHYLEWLEEFLIGQAYDVKFVETAAEAAKLAADKPFRVIIFDLNIPISTEMRELALARGGNLCEISRALSGVGCKKRGLPGQAGYRALRAPPNLDPRRMQ